jgi:AraC family transcriptional regulator
VAPSVFREERREIIASIDGARKGEFNVDVRIEHRPTVRVAHVRHVGPYDGVGVAWKALMKWGWSKMMFGKPETFGLSWDDPDVTPAEHVRYDACMVVDERVRPKGEVRIQEVPGGSFAVTLHEGPYENFNRTYAALFARVAAGPIGGRQWRLGDPPAIERYHDDPRKTAPEDLRTELMVRVQ